MSENTQPTETMDAAAVTAEPHARPALKIRMWTIIWGLFAAMAGIGIMAASGSSTGNGHDFTAMGTVIIVFLFLAAAALITRAIVAATRGRRA